MKKKTSNLIALLALGVLAVGVVGLASGGFKDWSAFTKARDNAASVIANNSGKDSSAISSQTPLYVGEGVEISASSYAFEDVDSKISLAVIVSDKLSDKAVRLSLSWDQSRTHSQGDPLDYVSISGQSLASRTTVATATCISAYTGKINVIAVNSEGHAAMVQLKCETQWELTAALPVSNVLTGTPVSSWSNKTFDGLTFAPANMTINPVNGQPGALFTVHDTSWFFLRLKFDQSVGIDINAVPDSLQSSLGETIGDDPVEINARKATTLLTTLGVNGYFTTFGGVVDGLEWERPQEEGEVTTNNKRVNYVYLACSMLNSTLQAGTNGFIADFPWQFTNTLEETATNIAIRHIE